MLQYHSVRERYSAAYHFEGLVCQANPNDLLGDGFSRRKMQESLDRGMFYCWADKIGTERDETGAQCTAGNYFPCWTDMERTYPVKGRWAENLWKSHKLTHAVHEEYIFLCRDGVLAKKRNLDAVREREASAAAKLEIQQRVKRLRGNPLLFRPFPAVAAAVEWLDKFTRDALRYPVLIVVGPSGTGKTEWAKSLFRNALELKVGALEHFPEGMRSFQRGEHDGIILDDVRDLQFLVNHQEKLQGKYDAMIEFASTPGGQLAFEKDLFAIPVVVTANRSTKNRPYLTDNDFLGNVENRVVVQFPLATDGEQGSSSVAIVSACRSEWSNCKLDRTERTGEGEEREAESSSRQ